MEILKKNVKTGEVMEKICFVDGQEVQYEFANPSDVSDGYHTFGELYNHRITLYIALCRLLASKYTLQIDGKGVWRSKRHSDGELCFGTGTQYVLGILTVPGQQITYHIPVERWEETNFAATLDIAPEWDGHSSDEVLERLKSL